ncbi:hypothetical protein CRUP_018061 [Coryphaenoides rupestris]|nr:hypothetical protein CRUP_018061 [Coryphaenoides rupestris]
MSQLVVFFIPTSGQFPPPPPPPPTTSSPPTPPLLHPPPPPPAVLGCGQSDCVLVLSESQGEFSSPCYPQDYPKSLACKWTMQAPPGFIVQLSFLDFDLEEALGCIYDRVQVNTGSAEVKLCGLTAHGLTLNSTGSVMELGFTSDFSVQKKGFRVSYHHVAVALRNQKVKTKDKEGSVYFEYSTDEELGNKDSKRMGSALILRDGDDTCMELVVNGNVCSISVCNIQDVLASRDRSRPSMKPTPSMKPMCVTWTSSDGRVGIYFDGSYHSNTCPNSAGSPVPGGGKLKFGEALTCDAVGNVVDWDTGHWDIHRSAAVTDTRLSCSEYPPL